MSSSILRARSSQSKKGVSFHFKFPTTGLSLRSVVLEEDRLPKLHFDAANCSELPTLTEEDVATVARVITEGKRPEFFYRTFDNPNHPFCNTGRLYKLYSPQWLRGTSVGDLLSEADWSMKCLHVGTRSNAAKTKFWSWQKTSKLDDLAVHMDFPYGERLGCVMMSCESVKTEESENEILFLNEPKMKITDRSKPMYTEYITEYYNNVAYYDEPLFLKMQELMKLITALEWLKGKGVMFSKNWMKYHTSKKPSSESQTLAVDVKHPEETTSFIEQVGCLFEIPELQNFTSNGPYGLVSMKVEKTKQTESGIEVVVTKNCPNLSMQVVSTVRTSFDDYDFLYEGIADCREPFTLDDNGKLVKPDVSSWSELFAETVPAPNTIGVLKNEQRVTIATGGITTSRFPVDTKKVQKVTHPRETIGVKSSRTIKIRNEETKMPKREPVVKPSTTVPAKTLQAKCNEETVSCTGHGYIDEGRGTMHMEEKIVDMQACKFAAKERVTIDGKVVTEERSFNGFPAIFKASATHESDQLQNNHQQRQKPLALKSGVSTTSSDDGAHVNGTTDCCFSPSSDSGNDGYSRFPFVSPIGSGDEMDET